MGRQLHHPSGQGRGEGLSETLQEGAKDLGQGASESLKDESPFARLQDHL